MKCVRVGVALYDYAANTAEELTFKAGDLFHILEMEDSDWWTVRTTTGDTGLVPSNYVDEAPVKAKVIVKWDCPAKVEEELDIVTGEVLELLDDSDEDWWMVRKGTALGLAPAIYLEIQPDSQNIFEAEEVQVPAPAPVPALAAANGRAAPPLPSLPPVTAKSTVVKKEWAVKAIDSKQRKGPRVMLQVTDDEVLIFHPDQKKISERMNLATLKSCSADPKDPKDVKMDIANSTMRYRCHEQSDSADLVSYMNGILAAEGVKKFLVNKKVAIHPPTQGSPAGPAPTFSPASAPAPAKYSTPAIPIKTPAQQAPAPAAEDDGEEEEEEEEEEEPAAPPPIVGPSPAAKAGVPPPVTQRGAKIAKASYDFHSEHPDELSITEGEDLIILEDTDPEWWLAQRVSKNSQKGLVPATYVQVKESLDLARQKENVEMEKRKAEEMERKRRTEEQERIRKEQEEQRALEAERVSQEQEKRRQAVERMRREEEEKRRREEEAKKFKEAEERRLWEEEERRKFELQEKLRREEEERKWREAEETRVREEKERKVRSEKEAIERERREAMEKSQQEAERRRQEHLMAEAERIGLQMLEKQTLSPARKAPELPPAQPAPRVSEIKHSSKDAEKDGKKRSFFFNKSKDQKPPQLPARNSLDVYGSPEKGAPASPITSKPRTLPSVPSNPSLLGTSPTLDPLAKLADIPDPTRVRQWSDKSGAFKVYAQLVEVTEGKAILHKTNGVKIAVPLAKLSDPDSQFIAKEWSNSIPLSTQPILPVMPAAVPVDQRNLAAENLKKLDHQVASKMQEEERQRQAKHRQQIQTDEEFARELQKQELSRSTAAAQPVQPPAAATGYRSSSAPGATSASSIALGSAPPPTRPAPQTSPANSQPPPYTHPLTTLSPSLSAVSLGAPPQSGRRNANRVSQSGMPTMQSQPLTQPAATQPVARDPWAAPPSFAPAPVAATAPPAKDLFATWPAPQSFGGPPPQVPLQQQPISQTQAPSNQGWTAFPSAWPGSSPSPSVPAMQATPSSFASFPTQFPSQVPASATPASQPAWNPAPAPAQKSNPAPQTGAFRPWENASPDNPFGISSAPKVNQPAAASTAWLPSNPSAPPASSQVWGGSPFPSQAPSSAFQPQFSSASASRPQMQQQQQQRPAFYQPVPLQQQLNQPHDPYSAFREVDPSAPSIIQGSQNQPTGWGQQSQYGGSLPFPNNLFYDGLCFLEYEARQTDDTRRSWAYRKAAAAIRAHPTALPNGKAAQELEGIGKSIGQRLDEMLVRYNQTGEYPAAVPIQKPGDLNRAQTDPIIVKTMATEGVKLPPTDISDEFGAILDDPAGTSPETKKKTKKPYIPKLRSGNYAILVALLIGKREPGSDGTMTKDQIITSGQKYSETSFTVGETDPRFTAWSGCDKLVQEGLVNRTSTLPNKFSLTPKGEELAEKLLTASVNDEVVAAAAKIAVPKNPAPAALAKAATLPVPLAAPAVKVKAEGALKRAATDAPQNVDKVKKIKVEPQEPAPPGPQPKPTFLEGKPANSSQPPSSDVPFDFHYLDQTDQRVVYMSDALVDIDSDQLVYKIEFKSSLLSHPFIQHVVNCEPHSRLPGFHTGFVLEEKAPPESPALHARPADQAPAATGILQSLVVTMSKDLPPPVPLAKASSSSSASLPSSAPSGAKKSRSETLPRTQSAPASVTSHKLIHFGIESFDIVLLVDNREIRTKEDRSFMQKGFSRNTINCEQRALAVGDFLWIARSKETGEEVVLNYIVERKRIDDLASSIIDGRFKEQKFRLANCGADDVIFVIEDKKLFEHQIKVDKDRMDAAIASTQIQDNYFVRQTDNIDDTVGFVSILTFQIEKIYQKKSVVAIGGDIVSRNELSQLRAKYHAETGTKHHISYELFERINSKEKNLSQRDLFVKQLIQIKNLGPDKALAITEQYPTLSVLIQAYDRASSQKDKEELLQNVAVGMPRKKLGIQMSRRLYHLYCDEKYSS